AATPRTDPPPPDRLIRGQKDHRGDAEGAEECVLKKNSPRPPRLRGDPWVLVRQSRGAVGVEEREDGGVGPVAGADELESQVSFGVDQVALRVLGGAVRLGGA